MEAGERQAVPDLLPRERSGLSLSSRLAAIRPPTVLLLAAAAGAGALLIAWQSHLTFLIDDWDLLLHRRGFSAHAFLDPHANHIILAPAAIYKAIQATLGMDSLLPFAVVSTSIFLASAVLLFVYLRRRVGDWLALAATVLVLFMGSAYQDLLTPFQLSFFGSMACGLGALVALERRDSRGDAIACALLVGSFAFSEVGLPFAVGAAVALALDRGPARRAYVVAVPVLLYAVWYLGWGDTAPSQLNFNNVATSPSYVLDGMASSVSSLFSLGRGLGVGSTSSVSADPLLGWGRPLLIVVVVAAAVRLRAMRPVPGSLWVALAIALSFWYLTAANANWGRPPTASRYQYLGGIFVLLIAAELVRGARPGWRALVAVFAVVGSISISNLSALHQSYRSLVAATTVVRGGLGGLEIAADTVRPGFLLTQENSDFPHFNLVDAGSYLSAVDKFGSPAYSPAQLAAAPEPGRVAADKVLASALRLSFRHVASAPAPAGPAPRLVGPAGARVAARGSCLTVRPAGGASPIVSLPRGGVILRAPPKVRADASLRRYAADSFPVVAGTLHGAAVVAIPGDRSSRPWQLQLAATGPITVCGRASP